MYYNNISINLDVCSKCQHVVAHHFYSYLQDDKTQEFNMDCFLCGRGSRVTTFTTDFAVHIKPPNTESVDTASTEKTHPTELAQIRRLDISLDQSRLKHYETPPSDEPSDDWK